MKNKKLMIISASLLALILFIIGGVFILTKNAANIYGLTVYCRESTYVYDNEDQYDADASAHAAKQCIQNNLLTVIFRSGH